MADNAPTAYAHNTSKRTRTTWAMSERGGGGGGRRRQAGRQKGELGLGKEETTATTPGLNLEAAFPGNKTALL